MACSFEHNSDSQSSCPAKSTLKLDHRKRLALFLLGLALCVFSTSVFGHARLLWSLDTNHLEQSRLVKNEPLRAEVVNGAEVDLKQSTGTDDLRTHSATSPADAVEHQEYSSVSHAFAAAATDTINDCGNSQRWLRGPRHGNLRHDPLVTDDLAKALMLNLRKVLISEQRHSILGQTICHADGRFRNDTAAGVALDDRTVRLWTVRLIYYAIHYHQHRLALPELSQRYREDGQNSQCSPQSLFENYNVSTFDYECPDAKYIIIPLSGNGLGANVRGGMVPAYLMGLTSDRIVLFVNNAAEGNKDAFLTSRWLLASCPRQDYQCFFMPPSPCTLTVEEIASAHLLDSEAVNTLRRSLLVPEYDHHKVWSFNPNFSPTLFVGPQIISKLQEYAQLLVDAVPDTPENDLFRSLLQKAVENIGVEDAPREEQYSFAARWSKIHHALSMYSVRPSPSHAAALDEIMKEIIPNDLDVETSVGLPVRGSDKCEGESDCISFDDHMTVVADFWSQHVNQTGIQRHPTVIFTTEDKNVMDEQKAWVDQYSQNPSPIEYEFVINGRDILPGSGFIRDVVWRKRRMGMAADPDANMLSSMSSLKAQLLPRLSIGNCCSNFHTLLNDFLLEGCGAASENSFLCLNENPNPLLRICCGWHMDCKIEKEAFRQSLMLLANNATST